MSCHLRGSAGLRVMYVCRSRISVISPSVSFLLISIYVCARFMLMIVSMQTTLTLALGLRCYCVSFGSCGSCKPVRCGITNLSTSFTAASKRFRQWMCRCGAQPSTRCSTEVQLRSIPPILHSLWSQQGETPYAWQPGPHTFWQLHSDTSSSWALAANCSSRRTAGLQEFYINRIMDKKAGGGKGRGHPHDWDIMVKRSRRALALESGPRLNKFEWKWKIENDSSSNAAWQPAGEWYALETAHQKQLQDFSSGGDFGALLQLLDGGKNPLWPSAHQVYKH